MDEMVLLAVVYHPEDAIIEGVLQAAGIKVIKRRESIAPIEGIAIGPLAEIKIYVSAQDLDAAREFLSWSQEGN